MSINIFGETCCDECGCDEKNRVIEHICTRCTKEMAYAVDKWRCEYNEAQTELYELRARLGALTDCGTCKRYDQCNHAGEVCDEYESDQWVVKRVLRARCEALEGVLRELVDACDRLMGDSDLPDDDSHEMKAMRHASSILKKESKR